MRIAATLSRAWDAQAAPRRVAWLAMAMGVLLVAVLVLVAAPLSEAIARARLDIARNRVALDIARARGTENAMLVRAAPATRTAPMRAAIERVLSHENLKFTMVDARSDAALARIVIADAPFDALVRALDTLARADGVRVVEATVTARIDPGTVRAELALTR